MMDLENFQLKMKAQSSIIMVLIVVMMFVALAIFLLTLASTVSSEQFTSLYANNLLLSVMRTDTGYSDPKCKLVSDLVFCAYFDKVPCAGSQKNCLDIANETIEKYMTTFENKTKNLRYLFTITTPGSIAWDTSGEPVDLDLGDTSLKKSKVKTVSYPLVISKAEGSSQYTLRLQLMVANK